MKKKVFLLLGLVIILVCCTAAQAGETDECEHQWENCLTGDFEYDELEATVEPIDEQMHSIRRVYPKEMCAKCGATQGCGYGAGKRQVHSYDLVKWEYINHNSEVVIFLRCRICEYDYVMIENVQNIIEGREDNCLLGGTCPDNLSGSMYAEGIAATDGSRKDELRFSGVIEMPCENGANQYYIAYRTYCPICGRPERHNTENVYGEMPESWKEWVLYTEEEFLKADMPDNLPYQLVDQLRADEVK